MAKEYIYILKMVKLPNEDDRFRGSITWESQKKDFMKVGWETWVDGAMQPVENDKLDPKYTVHPENNEFYINFDPECFKITQKIPYDYEPEK